MTIDELLEEVDAGLQHRGGWYSLQIPSTTEQLAAEVRRLRKVARNSEEHNDKLLKRERVLVDKLESIVANLEDCDQATALELARAAMIRASLDLTKALARMRRGE